jgi:predicted nucleic acid-binding protein
MANNHQIYWDSNVFLSLLDGIPSRINALRDLIAELKDTPNGFILTSSESIVEVSNVADEKTNGRLDPKFEIMIDKMWNNHHLIKMIDNGPHIAPIARRLIRDAIPQGWALKPKDAVHLASCYWYNRHVCRVDEFQTYDGKLIKFAAMIGVHICEPHVQQMRLIE